MKKQPIVLINLILFISLLGIIIFQFSWINQIVKLNDESFKKEIQEILSIVSVRLEEKEIYELTKDNLQSKINIKRSNQDGQIELIESSFVKKILDSINSENTSNDFLRFNFETGDQQTEKSLIVNLFDCLTGLILDKNKASEAYIFPIPTTFF